MKLNLKSASIALLLSGISISANATSLLEAYKDAVQNDPAILKAKAQYDIARESENIAFSSLLPSVGLQASYSINNGEQVSQATGSIVDYESNSLSYGVSLSQSIFNMKDWYSLDESEKQALQAQASYDLAKQALIVRVTNAYFAVLKAEDNLEFVEAQKKAIARQLEQTKQRFNVGLTAITDVHEAQANYDNVVANEIRSKNDIEIAKEGLREITGKYYREFSGLNTDRFEASLPSPLKIQEWVNKAESGSLELKASELGVEIAKLGLKSAQAGHYPTLSLSAGLNSVDAGGDSDAPALNSSSIGLTLNVPLYTGGATNSGVKIAQSNYVIAGENLESTHRKVVKNVRTSYAEVVALVSTLKAYEQSVVSAESALKATQAGFEVGTRTIVDVLNSTQNLYSAKQRLSNSRYGYVLAMLSLKQASGSLNDSDVEAVNSGLAK